MASEDRVSLLARVARARSKASSEEGDPRISILSLAAASYGARPSDEATVPTGFDPQACALFEAIVEGAFLVASADGVFDEAERVTFENVVSASCGGTVAQKQISDLVADLEDQLQEGGLDRRIAAIGEHVAKKSHGKEVLRIAALLAQTSGDVSQVERGVLGRIARACQLEDGDVDAALADVKSAIADAAAAG
jgi:tellurite resistance protein